MCLDVVESVERNRDAKGIGWKVFNLLPSGELESQVEGGIRKIGKWLMSSNDANLSYPVGFYIFTNRKAAVKWLKAITLFHKKHYEDTIGVIKQVKWRDRLVIGVQKCWFGEYVNNTFMPGKTIVAKEMMIL